MYEKILNDIKQEYYQQNYQNDGQRFIAWYLRNIHQLDIYETEDCITDGSNDKQIDAILVNNENSTIYIIQGKFYNSDSVDAEPLREVLSSWVQIKNLDKLQEDANPKLKAKIQEMSTAIDDDYEICFELITTSELTDAAKKDLEVFQKELTENETLQANIVVIDNTTLKFRYDESLNKNRPYINYDFNLEKGKYMQLMIGDTKAVIAAIPLKDCVKIPGIKDGSLFRKNVRQSLGTSNKVNKGIAQTIKTDASNFFFLHNGITAICSQMEIENDLLSVKELNVVNGCQSLSTIFNCSESAKKSTNTYIMFKFYEIVNTEQADKISTSTNSQSAAKARDLRSNDKCVIAMKKAYELCYPDGYFITKRGESVDNIKYNKSHIVNLTDLGKQLIAWHSQRPTVSYSETKIFDKYFDQLFRRDYSPQNIQALHEIFDKLYIKWNKDNPLGLNETLLAMKAYAPYHQLYAISIIFCEINKMNDLVPSPCAAFEKMCNSNCIESVIKMAADCLNMAMETALSETKESGKIFVPQNWIKSKTSLKDIRTAIRQYLSSLKIIPSGKEFFEELNNNLRMSKNDFEARWSAD